jgi:hypothetical protein
MNCLICGTWYTRGTDTLPNWCSKCLRYLTIVVAEPSIESQIKHYEECIELASENITDKYAEIARDKDNIKFWEKEIKKLRKQE